MDLILGLVLGGGCFTLGAYWLRRRGRRRDNVKAATSALETNRTIDDLRPDDVLSMDGIDWIVAGVAWLTDGVHSWIECRIDDAGRETWLVVDQRDPLVVLHGQRCDNLHREGRPSESVEHRGRVFSLERYGQAKVIPEGIIDPVFNSESCGYWNYRRPGEHRVWLREIDGVFFAFAGTRLPRHLVSFLPGS